MYLSLPFYKRRYHMKIIETVDCPLCDSEIAVIVEDNKITSHGVCPKCDRSFSPERLTFTQECQAMETEFLETFFHEQDDFDLPCHPEWNIHTCDDRIMCEADWEIGEFFYLLAKKGVTS
jgi:hypothetical protein